MQARPPQWSRLRLSVPPEAADAVASFCLDHGAPGVVTGNRNLRRFPDHLTRSALPPPRRVQVEAFFPPAVRRAALRREAAGLARRISGAFPGSRPGSPSIEAADPEALSAGWERGFKPVRVGRRLVVAPPWDRPESDGRIVLEIEPARAFGTGQHPTTRGCLTAIDRRCATGELPLRGLDVGCGSGILALAMRALGVRSVVGVDVDPVACEATLEAAARNHVDGIRVLPRIESVRGRFDLVVANLFADPLVELAPRFARLLAPGGTLVVSGLLVGQEARVRRALTVAGLRVVERRARSGWIVLVANPGETGTSPARRIQRTTVDRRRADGRRS